MGVAVRWRPRVVIGAALVTGVLLLGGPVSAGTAAPTAPPGTALIADDSHVLSRAEVASLRSDASGIASDPVRIYLTTSRDEAAFDRRYMALLGSAPSNVIIIAVNTRSRHIIITSGPTSGLTDSAAGQARQDFTSSYRFDSSYANALRLALSHIGLSVALRSTTKVPVPDAGAYRSDLPGVFAVVAVGIALLVSVATVLRVRSRDGRRYRGHSSPPVFSGSDSFGTGGGDAGGGGGTSGGNF